MAEPGPDPLERLRAGELPPASRLLGLEVRAIDAAAGTATVAFRPVAEFCNPMGVVQGGFVVAMLDEAMAIAGTAATGFTAFVPTLEIKTSFLQPVLPGPVIAHGRVVHRGKSTMFLEARLENAEGSLLATASATTKLVHRDRVRLAGAV